MKKRAEQVEIGDIILSGFDSEDYETDYREVIDIRPAGFDLSGVAIWCEELDYPHVMHCKATVSVQVG